MSHFFDTSVLVAAFDDQDAHHERARPVLLRQASGAAIALHSVAETFSILTGRYGWRPADAFEVLQANTAFLKKVSLTPAQYLHTLESAESLGIRGGAIYDALTLACARKVNAAHVWTFNTRHFLHFAPDWTGRIREP